MDEEQLNSYDSAFDIYSILKNPVKQNYRYANTPTTEVARGLDYGDSIYDKFMLSNVSLNEGGDKSLTMGELISENRAQRQPWIAKAGAGLARVGSKALTEIVKMPGVLGGIAVGAVGQIGDAISGKDNTDFMQTAFNNSWVQGLNDINEQVNSELLPVYVKKAVKEGNLWDNITSLDFWATEGADGVGYIVSMLVPGAVINRFNVGAKMAGIGKLAKMGDKMDEAVNVLGKLKMSPRNANLATGTIANTLFEAGAEAQGAMESFKSNLDYKLSLPEGDPDKITQEEYDSQIGRASEVGRNVFVANAAILIGPNAIMSKMLWGKPRNKGMNIKAAAGGKTLEEVAAKTLKQKVGNVAKTGGIGALSEGFWEEGMQSTAEQYFTKQGEEEPSKGFLSEFFGSIGDLPRAYAEMISETEGQKAIFLGAAFGGGMSMIHDYNSTKNEITNTNKLIKIANNALGDFYNVYNGDNFVEDPNASDTDKMIKKLRGFQGMETLSEVYNYAVETENKPLLESLREMAVTNLVKPFILNDNLGIEVLKEHLQTSKELIELDNSEWEGTTDEFIKHILNVAEETKKVYDTYKDFAPTILNFKNENATQQDKDNFYNELADNYVNTKSVQSQIKTELKKQQEAKDVLLAERGKTRGDLDTNALSAQEFNRDIRAKKLNESITILENQLKEANKEVEKLWDETSLTKRFDTHIKEKQKVKEENAKVASKDAIIDKIKAAKTVKEIDDITIPNDIAKDEIERIKENRKQELQVQKDLKDKDTATNNSEFNSAKKLKEVEAEDNLNYIKENLNEGEQINIDEGFGLDEQYKDTSATIKSISNKGVTVELEDGTTATISIEATKKIHYSNNANFRTEGGDINSVQEPSTDKTSGIVNERRGDSRIMSSDNKGGVLFGNEAALEFEQTPRDKVGEEKGIELNNGKPIATIKNKKGEEKIVEIEKRRSEELSKIIDNVNSKPKTITEFNEGDFVVNTKTNEEYELLDKNKNSSKVKLRPIKGRYQEIHDITDVGFILKPTNQNEIQRDAINKKYDAEIEKVKNESKTQEDEVTNINDTSIFSNNQLVALEMFNNKDFSDINFLINHLPLNVKLSEGVTAPLATKSEKSEEINKVFNATTRHLRETVIKEIVNNNVDLSSITVPIAGQWNGEIQVAPKVNDQVVENPVGGLYEFDGDISKIDSTDFYMVDDFGFLKNTEGKTFPTFKNKANAKGEIYLLINMANGKKFPLKLNTKKFTNEQADILYSFYSKILADEKNKEARISELGDEALIEQIKTVFNNEIELFKNNKKSFNRITIGDIVDMLVYENSVNVKSQLRIKGGKLFISDKVYTSEELSKPESKADFISILTTSKRQQIKFKKAKTDTVRDFHFENRSYVDYLLNGNILNTNAVIGKPTFAGKTSIYLDTKKVKVNGVESKFNSDVPSYASSSLIGKTKSLETSLPGLFKDPVQLNKDGSKYVNKKGKEFDRVSTLKDSAPNTGSVNVYNAAKRGDVVDEVIRQFFTKGHISKSDFIKQGIIQTIEINKKKPNSEIIMSDDFFGQLFDILEIYKLEFEKRNWTIYANSPSLSGTLGNKNYAGTGDLLVFDNNKNKWMFIDIKTSSKNRAGYYEGKDPYGYKKKDQIQQNAYRELFKQQTGIEIDTLLILPLTVASEDPGVNSEYRKVTIGLTKSDKKLLVVDTSKDIYQLIPGLKKTTRKVITTPTAKVQTVEEDDNFVHADDMEGGRTMDLSAFGITIEPKKAAPVKKITTKFKLSEAQKTELTNDFGKRTAIGEVTYKGNTYEFTFGSFYVANMTTRKIVTDLPLILNIITAYNKTVPKDFRVDIESLKKVWNSRLNVVPLQNKGTKTVPKTKTKAPVVKKAPIIKKVDKLNFEKLTNEEAETIIMQLVDALPAYLKEISTIMDNGKSSQTQVKELYAKLENSVIAKDIIETKCTR